MTFPDICVSSNWLYRSWPPSPPLPNVVYFIRRSKRESIYSSWLCYSAKGWKTYLWGKKIYLRKWEHKTVIQKEIRFSPLHLFNIKIRDLYQGSQKGTVLYLWHDLFSKAGVSFLQKQTPILLHFNFVWITFRSRLSKIPKKKPNPKTLFRQTYKALNFMISVMHPLKIRTQILALIKIWIELWTKWFLDLIT